MSPRGLDLDVVASRLRLLAELLDDLEGVGDVGPSDLADDRMLRHAVERILTQLVDLSVAINSHVASSVLGEPPRDYRSSFALAARCGLVDDTLAVALAPSVGLRNVLAHEYVDVDLAIVAASVAPAREGYRSYVVQASAWAVHQSEQ